MTHIMTCYDILLYNMRQYVILWYTMVYFDIVCERVCSRALFQSIFAHSAQDKRCWNGKPFPKQKERNSVNSENVLVVLLLYIYYSCQRLLWDIVHSIVNVTPSAIFRYISGKKGLSSSIQGPQKPNLTLERNLKMCLFVFLGQGYHIAWDDYLLLHIILDLQLHLA